MKKRPDTERPIDRDRHTWTNPNRSANDGSARLHGYGPILGAPRLLSALKDKLERENGLDLRRQRVMATAGGNQVRIYGFQEMCCLGGIDCPPPRERPTITRAQYNAALP